MATITYILRVISLSFLFGGSISIIVAAITLVKAAQANGVEAHVAATANAPMFITFSTIVLVCGFLLLLAESLDYAVHRKLSKLLLTRYAASLLCSASTMVLFFAIVSPMKDMLGSIHASEKSAAIWETFHKSSQIAFSVIILSALVSLILPAFQLKKIEKTES
jgi:hypothetical protein